MIRKTEEALYGELDGTNTIVYDTENDAVHVLNETASIFYGICHELSRENAVSLLEQKLREYDLEGVDISAEVDRIIELFLAKGLITVEG
jgi:hypothetical protein